MCPRLNDSKATSLSVKLLTNLICNYFMETWQQLYFILWRQYKNKIILKLTKIRNRLQLFAGMSANKLTIIGRGWEKYRDMSVASRSIISRSRRLKQIIDMRDTYNSWYFTMFYDHSITKFEYLLEEKRSAIFHSRAVARRRKAWLR